MSELCGILLQQQTGEGGSAWSGMIMILAMIVIFYFFMIRPQSKKQKELKKAREAMKKGDKVVTAGGIHGRIKDINDTVILMEIAQGVAIKIDKNSVFAMVPDNQGQKENVKSDSSKSIKKQKKDDDSPEDTVIDNGAALEEAAGKVSKK